jgi:hypothetical protein
MDTPYTGLGGRAGSCVCKFVTARELICSGRACVGSARAGPASLSSRAFALSPMRHRESSDSSRIRDRCRLSSSGDPARPSARTNRWGTVESSPGMPFASSCGYRCVVGVMMGGCSACCVHMREQREQLIITVITTRVGSDVPTGRPAFSPHVGQTTGNSSEVIDCAITPPFCRSKSRGASACAHAMPSPAR